MLSLLSALTGCFRCFSRICVPVLTAIPVYVECLVARRVGVDAIKGCSTNSAAALFPRALPRCQQVASVTLHAGAAGRSAMVLRRFKSSESRLSLLFKKLEPYRKSCKFDERFTKSLLEAVLILVGRRSARLGLARRYSEDLVQDVCEQAFGDAGRIREGDSAGFRAWIQGIANHVTAHMVRKERRGRRIESQWPGSHRLPRTGETNEDCLDSAADQIPDEGTDPAVIAMAAEESRAVDQAFQQVRPPLQDSLQRRVIAGETLESIAQHQGVSRRTVSRQMIKAHARFGALFKRSQER
jgi:RNA polymerase sigma factor (sigma-70 family)